MKILNIRHSHIIYLLLLVCFSFGIFSSCVKNVSSSFVNPKDTVAYWLTRDKNIVYVNRVDIDTACYYIGFRNQNQVFVVQANRSTRAKLSEVDISYNIGDNNYIRPLDIIRATKDVYLIVAPIMSRSTIDKYISGKDIQKELLIVFHKDSQKLEIPEVGSNFFFNATQILPNNNIYCYLTDQEYARLNLTKTVSSALLDKNGNFLTSLGKIRIPDNNSKILYLNDIDYIQANNDSIIRTSFDMSKKTVWSHKLVNVKGTLSLTKDNDLLSAFYSNSDRVYKIYINISSGELKPLAKKIETNITPNDLTLQLKTTFPMTYSIIPNNVYVPGAKISVGDDKIISVSSSGVITPLKEGTSTLGLMSNDGFADTTYTFTVVNNTITISPNSLSLIIGESQQLSYNVTGTVDKNNLIWTSTKPSIAQVDNKGFVSGLSRGGSLVIAKSQDGLAADTCAVTVKRLDDLFELEKCQLSYFGNDTSGYMAISVIFNNTLPYSCTLKSLNIVGGASDIYQMISSPVEFETGKTLQIEKPKFVIHHGNSIILDWVVVIKGVEYSNSLSLMEFSSNSSSAKRVKISKSFIR
jgi:uncharacterized protein YjdB